VGRGWPARLDQRQSPGRPLRWMTTPPLGADRTPPTGRLTVTRPPTISFVPKACPQSAARPRDRGQSRSRRGPGPRNRAARARTCRGSPRHWRGRAEPGRSSPIRRVGSGGWRSGGAARGTSSRAPDRPWTAPGAECAQEAVAPQRLAGITTEDGAEHPVSKCATPSARGARTWARQLLPSPTTPSQEAEGHDRR